MRFALGDALYLRCMRIVQLVLSPDPSRGWPAPMPVSSPTTVERKDTQSCQTCVRHSAQYDPVSYAISSSLPSSDEHAHSDSSSKIALGLAPT